MNEKSAKADRFNWRLPLYAAMGALVAFLATSFFGSDTADLLYIFFCIVVSLFLLIVGIAVAIGGRVRRSLAIYFMLIVFWSVSWALLKNGLKVRTEARWLFKAKDYKAQVLAQLVPANGELKHIEWDGWGFPGAGDTVVYLVFDPNDSLAATVRSRISGKFSGIPCEVPEVRRLESNWYIVLFYTDTTWGHCV
jgi:hypothetical protein